MLFDGVQLVGGRVAAFAGQLSLGVVRPEAAGDVDVAATQVTAPLQGGGGGTTVYHYPRRQEVRVLGERQS